MKVNLTFLFLIFFIVLTIIFMLSMQWDNEVNDQNSQTLKIQNWNRAVELENVPSGVRCFELVGRNGEYTYHPFSCVTKQKE